MVDEGKRSKVIIASFVVLLLSVSAFFGIKYLKREKLRGVIHSCRGWRLNRLPQVKEFFNKHIQDYNVQLIYDGGDPRLIIYNSKEEEIEKINLSSMNIDQIHKLLTKKGFKKWIK